MRVGLFAVVLLVTSCGEPRGVITSAPLTSTCAIATGTYVAEETLQSKSGVCPRMKEHSRDRLVFDDGVFVSPAAAFIPCKTTQDECTVIVTCQVLDMEMVFRGEVVDEGARLVGVATFTGKGDCKSAVYDVDATRP